MRFFSLSRRALFGLLAGLLLCPSSVQAAPRTEFVEGYITAVRIVPGGRAVTIEENGVPVTLMVTARTRIGSVDPLPPPPYPGPPRPPVSLSVGRFAQAQYVPATRLARSIALSSQPLVRVVRGTLVSTEPLTLDEDADGMPEHIFPGHPFSGPVLLGSVEIGASLLPLLEGLTADVLVEIERDAIARVRVELPATREATAQVLEVDPAARTLTLRQGLRRTPVIVAAGAEITARGRRLPLEALRAGDIVQVLTARTPAGPSIALRMRLTHLTVRTASGRVTAVDPQARSLTVATRNGLMTFHVPSDGSISVQFGADVAQPGTLSELAGRLAWATLRAEAEYLQRPNGRILTRVQVKVFPLPPPPPPD